MTSGRFHNTDGSAEHVKVTTEDIFIDLGSGVGQVVLQMAGSSPLKICIGVERADIPSKHAELMDANFRRSKDHYIEEFLSF